MKVTVIIQLVAFVLLAASPVAGQISEDQVDETNDIKQICLGLLNYEAAHQHLPARYNVSNNNREPLLSWRVHILPYIEEEALYEKFKLDEPWNSPHNLKLVEEMPDVFRSPRAKVKAGRTVYLGLEHERSGLTSPRRAGNTPKGSRIEEFTAGTSQTIIVVRANDEDAVPWSKPEDLEVPSELSIEQPVDRSREWQVEQRDVDTALTRKALFPTGNGNRLVGMMDGSINKLTPESFSKQPFLTGLLAGSYPAIEAYPVAQLYNPSAIPPQIQEPQQIQSSWPIPNTFAANQSSIFDRASVATSTVHRLTNEALQAIDQEQREAKLKELQKVLEDSFDQEHGKQRKRLESLQKQVAAIEQNLNAREKNRDRLIQNHVDRIRLQAEGLTIPSTQRISVRPRASESPLCAGGQSESAQFVFGPAIHGPSSSDSERVFLEAPTTRGSRG